MLAGPQAEDAMCLGFDFSEFTSIVSRMTDAHKCASRNLKRSVWVVCGCDFSFM